MAEYLSTTKKKITAPLYFEMKQNGEKISWLTAYDYTTASIIDAGGVDTILVGDSASNVADGNMTTLPITVDQMIYHARSVARAVNHALVVCDMPFGSYQVSAEEGLRNAIRIMKEAGVDAVKIEGGAEIAPMVKRMVDAGIPVSGHLGLTLDEAGCFCIVLEKIPADLAKKVTEAVSCATIGIGAGPHCDGQVLVYADMLGMNRGFKPKFLRQYADLYETITNAVGRYVNDVKTADFPNETESY